MRGGIGGKDTDHRLHVHVTPPHMPTKNKTYLNQKIIVVMWKNIHQLFQLQHIHPQLPLEKYVEADAGK